LLKEDILTLDFDECCNQMLEFGYEASPSELHGLLSGVICTGLKIRPDSIITLVLRHLDVESCSDANRANILSMYAFIEREMFSSESRYALFLPDDELDITQRLRCLAAWCQGFLVGFGTASAQKSITQFSAETEEALKDIVNISNLSEDFSESDQESNEQAYVELVEYLKVAVLLMSSEMVAGTSKDG
jgi:yecA family protein